jgi:hypothetical protein
MVAALLGIQSSGFAEKWTLKQVQGDGLGVCRSRLLGPESLEGTNPTGADPSKLLVRAQGIEQSATLHDPVRFTAINYTLQSPKLSVQDPTIGLHTPTPFAHVLRYLPTGWRILAEQSPVHCPEF